MPGSSVQLQLELQDFFQQPALWFSTPLVFLATSRQRGCVVEQRVLVQTRLNFSLAIHAPAVASRVCTIVLQPLEAEFRSLQPPAFNVTLQPCQPGFFVGEDND